MKYRVIVIDRDYHCQVDEYVVDFVNEDEAQRYCKNNSWTGEDYHAYKIDDKGQQRV